MKFKEELEKLGAFGRLLNWVGDRTEQEAWEQCECGDWLLWYYSKKYPDNIRELTLVKGHCANTLRHFMTDKRSRDAVDAAIAFGEGKITREELDAVYAVIYDVFVRFYNNMNNVTYSFVSAAVSAAAPSYCHYDTPANYAAKAVYYDALESNRNSDYCNYSAHAAAYAAAAAAKKENQKLTADICRKYLKI